MSKKPRRAVKHPALSVPSTRAHDEFPPGTPIPRAVLQVRLRDLAAELAQLERPAFGDTTALLIGVLTLVVAVEIALSTISEGPVRWLPVLAALLLVGLGSRIWNRAFERSGPVDDRRAEVLGDIAYLRASTVEPSPRRWPRRRTARA